MSFGKTNYRNGGTRGGADQFKWDDVKNDKYRENYLGNSVNAPVGRWQKGKDLTWYTKLSKADRSAALQEEIALAKQRDQDLMNQALGIAPKRRVEPTGPLDANEMKELLKRGASDREGLDAERVEGLGAAPVPEGFEALPKKTLAEKYQESMANGRGEDNIHALPGAAVRDDDERARKKAAKKEKKEKKKEKKERKKEKKASKQRRETDDRNMLSIPASYTSLSKMGKRMRISLIDILLTVLNLATTALTLFAGLSENPLLVALTGRYDPIRARLIDGSINMDIARSEVTRIQHLTPLEEMGAKFRFITAPRRTTYSYAGDRSLCRIVNSVDSTIISVNYNDFWGKQARRYQILIYSISAPNCKVINFLPKWYNKCIGDRQNSTTACHQYIFDQFDSLRANRLVQMNVVSDFGEPGVPFLKCLARPFKTFEYQTDMLSHQAYWAGADHQIQIQTSDCRAEPLVRSSDWEQSLFRVDAVDDGADVVLAFPPSGWFATAVSALYSVVSLVMIASGVTALAFQTRTMRYLPDAVRYSKDRRFVRFLLPFMPVAELMISDPRSVIPLKGSLLVASDIWLNHWLYMTLSILDAITTFELSMSALRLGSAYLRYRVTVFNFLFVCSALTRMSWLTCFVHTLLRWGCKLTLDSLKSMQAISRATRDRFGRHVDESVLFISFKIYNVLLCVILYGMMESLGTTSFMVRDVPGKVAAYGGIPKIGTFWRSELVCDFVTIVAVLITSGQALGILFLLTPFRRIAKNHVMQNLQQRYFWVGWDGLMASKMLGLDPLRSDVYIDGHAYTKCSLGTVLQLLSMSGPSSFVRLGGDDLLTVGGLSIEPTTFAFPVKRAIALGLCESGRGVVIGASSTAPSTKTHTTQTRQPRRFTDFAPVDESTEVRTKKSLFDRQLKLIVDGYTGVVLLVDLDDPGNFATNKETGLREYVVSDALATISLFDIRGLLGNEKKLRIE
ncbi:hypothetical protein Poli38472_008679 [Pythium oligandrum]|uniref:Multiple myeloma tumor-associated protein 2-like N-terminal domain-containing protein n=1 Tax=Pythium oligandrum TaxID=41045 RepID=A0A8K1C3V8_PYTOL|nr:hypothetical protein Poli38472_008679 [Pythium oligandrum]|eukprot:TMW56031.1 hypothetical protein Poli38472_008679 [Pythium oligandrum]